MTRTASRRAEAPVEPEALLAAFAEPTRLRLLALMQDGEVCVCDLVGALDLPQPTVSRHLGVLRRTGLVRSRKDGLWMWYSLAPARGKLHVKLLEALACCRSEVPGLSDLVRRCCALRDGRSCC